MRGGVSSGVLILLTVLLLCASVAQALPVGEPPDDSVSALARGQYLMGEITSGPDFDRVTLAPARFGDRLFVLLSGLGTVDTIVQMFDPADNSVFYNDDGGPVSGGFRSSLFAGERMPYNGVPTLQIDGFGSSFGKYEVYQVVLGPNESVNEVEPNDSIAQAMPIQSAAIEANGGDDPDFYSFFANAGEKIVVFLDNDPIDRTDKETNPISGSGDVNKTFSSIIDVIGTDGTTIISTDPFVQAPNSTFSTANVAGAIAAPTSGKYFVRITKTALTHDHPYTLVVTVNGDTAPQGACCYLSSCSIRTSLNCIGRFAGAGTTCDGDTDGDGVANDCDNCKAISNPIQTDSDGDESGDECDSCSTNALKTDPGQCGCGTTDLDTDNDGTADCNDLCPSDPSRTEPGACGCNAPNVDANSNGIQDCNISQDLRAQLNSLNALLKAFKPLGSGANAVKKQAQQAKIAKIKGILTSFGSVQTNTVPLTVSGFDFGKALSSMRRSADAALKAKGQAFSKNKNSALTQIDNLLRVIA